MTILWEFAEKHPKQVGAYGTWSWVGWVVSPIVHFRGGGIPGLHPGEFSAVPTGLHRWQLLIQDLRPGLLLAVPPGLNLDREVPTYPVRPGHCKMSFLAGLKPAPPD